MCYLEYINVKNNLIVYRCFCCNRNYQKMFNEDLKKWFAPAFESSDNDFNQLILQYKKSIYPYEDMINDWEKLDETPSTETPLTFLWQPKYERHYKWRSWTCKNSLGRVWN